jgi:hypothetical protein
MPSGLGEFRVTETFASCFRSLQSSRCPCADDFPLVLGHSRQDMDGQLVGMRIIDRHELHTGIHQGRYECQVAGQAVELGNDELGFLLFAGRERLHQLRPIIALAALDFGELTNQRPGRRGREAPNIVHTNTLTENLADIQEKDRVDVVMANPPFGGKERKEVQQNFPIRTGETAFLFLQHFIKMLKAGGRGGIVIKNTFLSNTDNASVSLRKLLLESCNLYTVLDCPGGTFQGAGVKTVVLFFEKGAPTRKVWYYQLDLGRNLGKTNPLNDEDLAEFVKLQKTFADSPKSWSVDAKSLDETTFDLSVKNPNGGEEIAHLSPKKIMEEIAALDAESGAVLQTIKTLNADISKKGEAWVKKRLGDVCTLQRGYDLPTRLRIAGKFPLVTSSGITDSHNEFRVKGPGVVTGRSGSIGNVFYIEDDFWPLNTALYVKDFHGNDPKFVYRLLIQFDLERFATGAGVPTLNRNFVHDEVVVIPESATVQRAIVSKHDSLEKETQRLTNLNERKLAALEALKKSLLHQAFAGQL